MKVVVCSYLDEYCGLRWVILQFPDPLGSMCAAKEKPQQSSL